MPAYISIIMEFSRYELDFDNMKELNAFIKYAGLEFTGGAWHAEGMSLEEITDWNQKKLEDDFVLGDEENCENDYKQMNFSFGGFSEVRGFIMNNTPEKNEYTFTVLIPQEEVLTGENTYRREAVDKMKDLASKLWGHPKARTIQTELEVCEGMVSEQKIREGATPAAFPFAIVSEKQFAHMDTSEYTAEHIEYGGVIITPKRVKLV